MPTGKVDSPLENLKLMRDSGLLRTQPQGDRARRREGLGRRGEDMRHRTWLFVLLVLSIGAAGGGRAAEEQASGKRTVLTAGDLEMILRCSDDGVHLISLCDSVADQQLLAVNPLPLFTLKLRHEESKQDVSLTADAGWNQTEVLSSQADGGLEIRCQRPKDERLGDLRVVALATPDRQAGAIRWKFNVENPSKQCSIRRVVFPQLALAELGPPGAVFVPRAPGEVQPGLWQREFRYRGTYPDGWASMQFMAAYRSSAESPPTPQRNTGLYLAVHDPLGSTKDIIAESRPSDRAVLLSYDHPAADMGRPGNDFQLAGEAVWQLLRGDWFDAAMIYKDWVQREARWFPKLTAEGRADTPQWMRELPVWVMTGGVPKDASRTWKSLRDSWTSRSASTGTSGTRSPSTTTIRITFPPRRDLPRRSRGFSPRGCT